MTGSPQVQSTRIPAGRSILVAVAIVALSLLIVTLVVTGYAFVLAFQARGAPDQERIGQFGEWIGSWLTPALQVLLTYLGALWVRRRTPAASGSSGLVLGAAVAILAVASQLVFGWSFKTVDFFYLGIVLLAGWLGGRPKGGQTGHASSPMKET
jgi:hypothetical protein